MKKTERIIIVGIGKSGTTALYFKVKNSITEENTGVFEPRCFDDIQKQYNPEKIFITKILMRYALTFLEEINIFFTKKILIVRDPRDIVTSGLLYAAGFHTLWEKTPDKILDCIELLKCKERDPGSISVLKLIEIFDLKPFLDRMTPQLSGPLKLSGRKDYFTIKYEDFIKNNLKDIENYLGLNLHDNAAIDAEYQMVIRAKESGNWKDWFLKDDIDFFKPHFKEYLEKFNYDIEYVTNKPQIILPQYSSEYVIKVINERRKTAGLSLIT